MKMTVSFDPVFDLPIEGKVFTGDPDRPGVGMTSFRMLIIDFSTGEGVIIPDKKKRIRRKMKNNQHGK